MLRPRCDTIIDEYQPPRRAALHAGSDSARLVKAASLGDVDAVLSACRCVHPSCTWWAAALRKASANGHTRVVRTMLSTGRSKRAPPHIWGSHLHAAATFAAQNGHVEVLSELLKFGAPVALLGADQPLNCAARAGQTATANLLLSAGAPTEQYGNLNQDSPMSAARNSRQGEMAHLLRRYANAQKSGCVSTTGRQKRAGKAALHIPKPPPAFFSPMPPVPSLTTVEAKETKGRAACSKDEASKRAYLLACLAKPPEVMPTPQRAARRASETSRRLSRGSSISSVASFFKGSVKSGASTRTKQIEAFDSIF